MHSCIDTTWLRILTVYQPLEPVRIWSHVVSMQERYCRSNLRCWRSVPHHSWKLLLKIRAENHLLEWIHNGANRFFLKTHLVFIYFEFHEIFFKRCFVHTIFCFWVLVTFGDKAMKILCNLCLHFQGKMGKAEKTQLKWPKTKRQKYGMNETFISSELKWKSHKIS